MLCVRQQLAATVQNLERNLLVLLRRLRIYHCIQCYSAVFGVTLRLLVINTCLPPSTNSAAYHRLCDINLMPRSVAAECIELGGQTVHSTRWSQILADNRDFCLTHLYSTPVLGDPRRNVAIRFAVEKLEWCGYPMGVRGAKPP